MENRKMIITNLIGTLSSLKIQQNTVEGKKEFQILSQFLKSYLRKNHYIFILSNVSAYSSIEKKVKLYQNLCSCLEASQNSFFYFYVIGAPLSSISNVSPQFFVVPLQEKEQVLNTILSDFSITREDNLLGAGNNIKDIAIF